jgi:acetyltransferase-like isoleucine patch superfamily enzyme
MSQFKYCHENVTIFEPLVILAPEMIEIREGARLDSFIKIEGGQGVYIGKYVHIASFCHINIGGGTVILGDYSAYASGAKILAGSNKMDGISMSASSPKEMQVADKFKTVIGPYAFVSTNAVIMYGIDIGEGAVIAAGAVVTKNVPPYEVWAGIPAIKINNRKKL